jgi:hypothetical protein
MNPGLRVERTATNSLKHGTRVKRLMVCAVVFLVNVKFVNLSLCHGTAVNNEVEYANILSRAFLLKKQFRYCNFKRLNEGDHLEDLGVDGRIIILELKLSSGCNFEGGGIA